jgi:hypothetical protein
MQLLIPSLLWTLGAAALPVLIHLSRRRVFKEMHVGTLRFLSASTVPRKRRARLEEVLLMLLRMVALLLLALVFLRPYLPGSASPSARTGQTLILLDASGSITPEMAEQARAAAGRVLRDGKSPSYTLAAFADQVAILSNPGEYQPVAGSPTHTADALKWALRHFQQNPAVSGRVVLISHLAASQLPESAPQIWPPSIPVEIIPLKEPAANNIAVTDIKLLTPYAEREMEIEVMVSPQARKPVKLKLQAEGINLENTVPPGKNSCTFRFPVPRDLVRGSVTALSADPWKEDNNRPFAFARISQKRILLVDGRPAATPFDGQAYFIAKALSASGVAHGKSPFLPEIVYGLESNQGIVDLSPFAAVALCGVNEVSTPAAQPLASFVAGGGSLIHVLHDSFQPGAEALIAANLIPSGIQYRQNADRRTIARFDANHPAFAAFADKDYGNLADLPWQQRFAFGENPEWKPLLTLDNESPLLWERSVSTSSGRVMLLAHPLTRHWNDLPREPLFVPLVKNIFSCLSRLDATPSDARIIHPGLTEKRRIGYYVMPDESVELVTAAPTEVAMESVDPGRFREAFGLPDAATPSPAAPPPPADAPEISRAREWWPWIAVALLTMLLVENWFATRRIAAPSK